MNFQQTSGVFGVHPVLEAIKSGKTIDKILIQKGLRQEGFAEILGLAKQLHIPLQFVPVEKINRITRKNHQGVYAFVSPIDFDSIENLLPQIFERGELPLILVLDRITDVRNFGGLVRTAECAGFHAVVIPKREAASVNEVAAKTSSGALFHLPVCRENQLIDGLKFLKNSGLQIIAATEKAKDYVYSINLKKPTAIILGSEEDGISPALLRIADRWGKLPIEGHTQSLNVGAAGAAVMYEARRQRMFG